MELKSATLVVAVVAVAVIGLAGAADTATATADTGLTAEMNETTETNNTTTTYSGGELLSGVIAAQSAEFSGDLQERALSNRFESAESDTARADLIDREAQKTSETISELREEQRALNASYENESISRAEYVSRMAELSAQIETTKNISNTLSNESSELPIDVLEANNVNTSAIQTLQQSASNLTGPETAAIAQTIAGNGPADTPADTARTGPPSDHNPEETPKSGAPGEKSTTTTPSNDTVDRGRDTTPDSENDEDDDDEGDDSKTTTPTPGSDSSGSDTRGRE